MKRMLSRGLCCVLSLLPVAQTSTSARGDEAAEKIREVVAKNKDCIVIVKFTLTQSYSGRDRESVRTVPGALIAGDGLVLLAAGSLSSSLSSSKTSDFKIVRPDGKEIPAKLLAQDKELDLAFVKAVPSEQAKFVPLDLTRTAAIQLAERVVAIGRLSERGDYAPAFNLLRVNAVVNNPLTFYTLDGLPFSRGAPVFTLEGELVGFILRPAPVGTTALIPVEHILPSVESAKDMVVED